MKPGWKYLLIGAAAMLCCTTLQDGIATFAEEITETEADRGTIAPAWGTPYDDIFAAVITPDMKELEDYEIMPGGTEEMTFLKVNDSSYEGYAAEVIYVFEADKLTALTYDFKCTDLNILATADSFEERISESWGEPAASEALDTAQQFSFWIDDDRNYIYLFADDDSQQLGIMMGEDNDYLLEGIQEEVQDIFDVELPASFTIMVYMIGSNLESNSGAATKDIEEMQAALRKIEDANAGNTGTIPEINVVLCTGGSNGWSMDIPNDRNTIQRVTAYGLEQLAETDTNNDMTEAGVLAAFVNNAEAYFPADNYGLILWDHGGGSAYGYGKDELFEGHSMSLATMREAMKQTNFGGDRKFAFVGFDACLMSTLENASTWSPFAHTLIASEEEEPGPGWDYSFLAELPSTIESSADGRELGLEIGSEVVETFGAYYKDYSSLTGIPEQTLCVMDLAKVPAVTDAMEVLCEEIYSHMLTGEATAALATGTQVNTDIYDNMRMMEGVREIGRASGTNGYDAMDLDGFARVFSDKYYQNATAVSTAINEMVCDKTTNLKGCSGVSFYFPRKNSELYEEYGKGLLEDELIGPEFSTLAGAWAESVFDAESMESRNTDAGSEANEEEERNDAGVEAFDEGASQQEPEIRDYGDAYVIMFPENVSNEAVRAYYTVFREYDKQNGIYIPVLAGQPLDLPEGGVMIFNKNIDIFELVADGEERVICDAEHIGDNRYKTVGLSLDPGTDFSIVGEKHTKQANILFQLQDDRTVQLHGLVNEAENEVSARETSDFEDYGGLDLIHRALLPKKSEGSLLPYQEWDRADWVIGNQVTVQQTLEIRSRQVSECADNFSVQITLENASTHRTVTDLIPLSSETSSGVSYHDVDAGTAVLSFRLQDGEAVLTKVVEKTSINGKIVVPGEVEGAAVVGVGDDAFAGCGVSEVALPDTLREISAGAFSYCGNLKMLEIPAGVRVIGANAFLGCEALETVNLPESLEVLSATAFRGCSQSLQITSENDKYSVDNGMILTDNGETLVTVVGVKDMETLEIPSGIKCIAHGAAAGCTSLKQIVLPESLAEIGSFAFYNCTGLESLELPDGVEKVGYCAFGAEHFLDETCAQVDEIRIPAGLTEIKEGAFDALAVQEFVVADGNTHFSAVDGQLMNAAGDVLIAAAK